MQLVGVVSLDLDRFFPDFNFCALHDPTLVPGHGPTQAQLIRLVYDARLGGRAAASEFADTMYWTLRRETFECFQKLHGPRPIQHREWFYAKLLQLLEILVYEELSVDGIGPDGKCRTPQTDRPWEEGMVVLGAGGPPVQPDDVEAAFLPEDNASELWASIVQEISRAPRDRLATLEAIMVDRQKRRLSPAGGRRSWRSTKERNVVLDNLLAQGKGGRELCQELDKRTIATLPILQRHRIHSWVLGWEDPELQRNIQQLFSKRRRTLKSVKS